jgi:hypothetical protein
MLDSPDHLGAVELGRGHDRCWISVSPHGRQSPARKAQEVDRVESQSNRIMAMSYVRPELDVPIPRTRKTALLSEYVRYYGALASSDRSMLNRKLPNEAFADLLDNVGDLITAESARLAKEPGAVRAFLEDNPIPSGIALFLPDSVRAFCLVLNALKQWVNREQIAMDGYVFGRNARELCRSIVSECILTGDALDSGAELHHPVRDGRPPLLLSKKGHAQLEGQASSDDAADSIAMILIPLRRKKNLSWAHLRRGCLDLAGQQSDPSSAAMRSSARSYARKASEATGLGYSEILSWMDKRGV